MSKVNKHPVVTSYRSVLELVTLKDWFYNFNESADNRLRAVQRVKALVSRGRLPHAIEATSLLTSVTLSDLNSNSCGSVTKQSDSNMLQLSYSMALVRFVNGLLDPFQQSNFAIPLHQLAKNLKLPSLFVELRHMGTHEQLPNLDTLRLASEKALNWLFDNYWLTIEEIEGDEEEDVEVVENVGQGEKAYNINDSVAHNVIDESKLSEQDKSYINKEYAKLNAIVTKIVNEIKVFKKIRKLDLDVEYKFGNSTDLGKKYWKAIKNIKEMNEKEGYPLYIIQTLMYKNLLIYNADKLDSKKKIKKLSPLLIKLYNPLLEELGTQFKFQLLFSILYTLNHNEGDSPVVELNTLVNYKVGFTIHHDDEIVQLLGWARYLMENLLSDTQKFRITTRSGQVITQRISFVEMLLKDIPVVVHTRRLELLQTLLALFKKNNFQNQELGDSIVEAIEKMKKELVIKNYAPPPSLDDLLNESDTASNIDVEQVIKRPKLEQKASTSELEHFFFEKVENWEPTAFGTFV